VAAQPVQGGRGAAGQGAAFAGEVRLVGVAHAGGGVRQVRQVGGRVEQADEALEAEHSLQGLRSVAGGSLTAAAKLALAEAYAVRDFLGADGGVAEQGRGAGDGRVGGAVHDERAGQVEQAGAGLSGGQAGG
jgi:hypothetical protein